MQNYDKLKGFAKDENADQCYAIIREEFENVVSFVALADMYEEAKIEDEQFCSDILKELEPLMCEL